MKKIVLYIPLTLWAALVFSNAYSNITEESFVQCEKKIHQNFLRGNYFDLFDSIVHLVEHHPENPLSFLYLFDITRLGTIVGKNKAIGALEKLAQKINAKSCADAGAKRLLLACEMEKLWQPINQKKAFEIASSMLPVRKWILLGSYWKYGKGDLYIPFQPEKIEALTDLLPKPRRVQIAEDGILRFKEFYYPEAGVAYAAFSFRCSDEIKLRIFSDERYVLFVNGKQVLVNDENNAKRRVRIVRLWGCSEFSIMIKILKGHSWAVRVILTDVNDNPVDVPIELDRLYRADFRYAEEMEYPFERLMTIADETVKEFALACFFDELESDEALKFYKKSAERQNNLFTKYSYAAALMAYGGSEATSARNLEGRRLMKEIYDVDESVIPALHKKFRSIYDSKDSVTAVRFAKEIAKVARYYFPFRRDYVRLLRFLGYRKEFEEEIEKLKNDFPESIIPLKEEAAYYRTINPLKAAEIDALILEKEYSKKHLSKLVQFHRKRGEHQQALAIMQKYDRGDDLWQSYASILIDMQRYDEAKSLIYKRLLMREEPDCYRLLGFIDALRGDEPIMQWKRELEVRPSNFALQEYVNYLEKKSLYAFQSVSEQKIHNLIDAWKKGSFTALASSVLYRARMYELKSDGGSRAYCEDVILLNDKKAIERWGEHPVIHFGTFKPLQVRVYHPDGGYTESFSVQDIDGEKYINLPSLKEYSLAHIAYIVENPIKDPAYANLFALPPTEICGYEEPVKKFIFKVTFPAFHNCRVVAPKGVKITDHQSDEMKEYSFSMDEIPSIIRERFSGNRLNALPFYAFTTLKEESEFVEWYRGLLIGVFDINSVFPPPNFHGRGKTLIENVYEYVARSIELEHRKLYFPPKASDVLYRKRASVEGKVILAKAILEQYGILSFIAFARRMDRPQIPHFVSPHQFTDILLCVPVSELEVLWLDFSSKGYACGDVHPFLEGVEAYVMVGNGLERKRIAGRQKGITKSYFRIHINETNYSLIEGKVELFGSRGDFRTLMTTEQEKDRAIVKYFGYLFPSFDMDDYSVHNIRDYAKPLVLIAKGYCHSIAFNTGVDVMFKASPYSSEVLEYGLYEKRAHPLFISDDINEEDVFEYMLPKNAIAEMLPKKQVQESKFGKFEMEVHYDKGKNAIIVQKKVFVPAGRILQDEYLDFLTFCKQIKQAENVLVAVKIKQN